MLSALFVLALLGCEEAAKLQEHAAKAEETRDTLQSINGAIEMYRMKHKGVPRSIEAAFPGRRTLKDGWGNPFVYERPGPGTRKWEVISLGADGEPGGSGYDADIKLSEL